MQVGFLECKQSKIMIHCSWSLLPLGSQFDSCSQILDLQSTTLLKIEDQIMSILLSRSFPDLFRSCNPSLQISLSIYFIFLSHSFLSTSLHLHLVLLTLFFSVMHFSVQQPSGSILSMSNDIERVLQVHLFRLNRFRHEKVYARVD